MTGQRWVLFCSLLAFGSAAGAAPPEKARGRAHQNYDARGGPAVRDRAATLSANPSPALRALESSLGGHGLVANVTAVGELINVSGAPLSNLSGAAAAPSIGADEALAQARRNVGAPMAAVGAQRSRDRQQTTVFDTGER